MNIRINLVFCSASFAILSQAAAEEDTVTVTGLRPVAIEDITTSVTVISADDLAIRDTPYLADQLRAVPGLGISRSGAGGGLTQVRVRGAEANHTLVLINGIEISDPVTGETDFGLWAGLDASRVEILRGEQSTLYGSDAIGGVISIVANDATGASGFVEAGSEDTWRFGGRYGVDNDTGNISLGLSGFRTDGVDTSGQNGEEDGSMAYSGMFTGSFLLGDDWYLNGILRYSEDEVETDADSDFDGLLNDSDDVTMSDQLLIGAVLGGNAGELNHIIRASFAEVVRENRTDGIFSEETTGERTKISYSPSRNFTGANAEVTLSGQLDYEKEDYERLSTDTFFGNPNQSQSFETMGIAGEVQASWQSLSFNGSIRHDDNDSQFEDATTWRIGASYALNENTRLRASVGTGVKNPTFTELFGFLPDNFTGNPDLKPEKSTSYEIGLDYGYGSLNLSLTYFNAGLEDEIFTVFNPDFTSSPANRTGNSQRQGLEIAGNWSISDSLSASASLSDINSENDTNEDEIRVPHQTGSLALNWQSPDKEGLRTSVALDYVGEQNDFFFTFPAQRITLDSYALLSATVNYPLNDRVSLTLRGQNILDEEVVDVFGFQQTGAGFFLGLKVH